jgi:hypothetical protein
MKDIGAKWRGRRKPGKEKTSGLRGGRRKKTGMRPSARKYISTVSSGRRMCWDGRASPSDVSPKKIRHAFFTSSPGSSHLLSAGIFVV